MNFFVFFCADMREFTATRAFWNLGRMKCIRDPEERPRLRRHKIFVTPCTIQPFGHKLSRGIACFHEKFLNRTVMVQDNDVDTSMRLLNRYSILAYATVFQFCDATM